MQGPPRQHLVHIPRYEKILKPQNNFKARFAPQVPGCPLWPNWALRSPRNLFERAQQTWNVVRRPPMWCQYCYWTAWVSILYLLSLYFIFIFCVFCICVFCILYLCILVPSNFVSFYSLYLFNLFPFLFSSFCLLILSSPLFFLSSSRLQSIVNYNMNYLKNIPLDGKETHFLQSFVANKLWSNLSTQWPSLLHLREGNDKTGEKRTLVELTKWNLSVNFKRSHINGFRFWGNREVGKNSQTFFSIWTMQ